MSRANRLDSNARTLAETAPFSRCSRREIRAMCAYTTRIELKAGRVLVREGEIGMELFVVVAGRALIERAGVTLGVAGSGAVVGEIALLREVRRTATVTAITDMSVLVISRAELATMRTLRIASTAWDCLDRSIEARLERTDASSDCLTTQVDRSYFPCAPISRSGAARVASRGACS